MTNLNDPVQAKAKVRPFSQGSSWPFKTKQIKENSSWKTKQKLSQKEFCQPQYTLSKNM